MTQALHGEASRISQARMFVAVQPLRRGGVPRNAEENPAFRYWWQDKD